MVPVLVVHVLIQGSGRGTVTVRGGSEDAWLDDRFCTDGCGRRRYELDGRARSSV